ncbi:hypothetical protein LP420_30960 [Massilia sp. B-10]|nr:hypothetical protein LP420_30960 [Massilia sp. B-10]
MMLAVVAEHPGVAQAHNNLGYIDYLRGDHASAVLEMRMALTLDGGNERARNNLRLAETALAGGAVEACWQPVPAPVTAPASASPDTPVALAKAAEPPMAVLPVPAAPAPAARMELVQLIPNVYELKMLKHRVRCCRLPPQQRLRLPRRGQRGWKYRMAWGRRDWRAGSARCWANRG